MSEDDRYSRYIDEYGFLRPLRWSDRELHIVKSDIQRVMPSLDPRSDCDQALLQSGSYDQIIEYYDCITNGFFGDHVFPLLEQTEIEDGWTINSLPGEGNLELFRWFSLLAAEPSNWKETSREIDALIYSTARQVFDIHRETYMDIQGRFVRVMQKRHSAIPSPHAMCCIGSIFSAA